MNAKAFRELPAAEVARLVRADGPKVCVFPLNGTRRWFWLTQTEAAPDFAQAYLGAITTRLIELCQLLFEHGIDTLVMPGFSPRLLARGAEYLKLTATALERLSTDPDFLNFYDAFDVRARFYGDYRHCFESTPYTHLPDLFDQLTARTLKNQTRRLFWGICAHDATQTIIDLTIQYFTAHGKAPTRDELIELYYGERVSPVDLFISSAKPRAFDMPLISTGREDLYFMVAPSPYLNEAQLRGILYDHLYARRKEAHAYTDMQPEDWQTLRHFYEMNQVNTLGVGAKQKEWGLWYPLPQIVLTEGLTNV